MRCWQGLWGPQQMGGNGGKEMFVAAVFFLAGEREGKVRSISLSQEAMPGATGAGSSCPASCRLSNISSFSAPSPPQCCHPQFATDGGAGKAAGRDKRLQATRMGRSRCKPNAPFLPNLKSPRKSSLKVTPPFRLLSISLSPLRLAWSQGACAVIGQKGKLLGVEEEYVSKHAYVHTLRGKLSEALAVLCAPLSVGVFLVFFF